MNARYQFSFEVVKRDRPHLLKQVHGKNIVQIHSMKTFDTYLKDPPQADGIVTKLPGKAIGVVTADCVPLLAFHTSGMVGAFHCGWRGVNLGIVESAIDIFPTTHSEFIIGPSIRSCCYEIKKDFITAFKTQNRQIEPLVIKQNNKLFFDLSKYIGDILLKEASVTFKDKRCTYCHSSSLPSYRRQEHLADRLLTKIFRV